MIICVLSRMDRLKYKGNKGSISTIMSVLTRKLTNDFVLPLWNEKAVELIDEYFTANAELFNYFFNRKRS